MNIALHKAQQKTTHSTGFQAEICVSHDFVKGTEVPQIPIYMPNDGDY